MASDENIYSYSPSLPASVLFTILYFFPFIYHLYVTVFAPCRGRYNRAGHFIPLLIGAFLEVIGYAVRSASVEEPSSIPLYAVSATLIVIAPVFVCASLYLLMDRLIWTRSDDQAREKPASFRFVLRRPWLPRIFVTLDILSCLTQASGSSIASAGDWEGSEKDTGTGVLIGGLALQVATFAAFLLFVGSFHLKAKRGGVVIDDGVRQLLRGIYISGFFILVRCVYRMIEFALGIDAYFFNHEWALYVLEAVPMLIAISVLGWYHPARFLSPTSSPSAQ
ncbi:RTA1 domain protein [Penicillium canariense]|uniref:RTA1 domain protein n=1 Tax=Penicillium canariense TaxID=189055 RepID=A0A9W9HNI4_9EURO|nr:RTA1 domain protein [Penicillium canariense]KAJ5150884.1 RTA1 domain protein [Penicillium canariense]